MPEELDDLRRRLYSPDVTPEEVLRYRALAPDSASEPPPPLLAPHRPPQPSLRLVLGFGAAAAVLAGTAVLAATPRSTPPPIAAPRTATPLATPMPTPDEPALTLPASTQASFADLLRAGRSPAVLRYIAAHPDVLPPQLRTAGGGGPEEHVGQGPGMVGLTPPPAARHGGRLIVAVTVEKAVTVDLQVVRADSGMQSFVERLDGGAPATPGLPVVRTIVYDGEPPTIVQLTLPRGAHWDLVSVFTH